MSLVAFTVVASTVSKLAVAAKVLSAVAPVVAVVGNYIERNRENTK